jgi:hypothetical protein
MVVIVNIAIDSIFPRIIFNLGENISIFNENISASVIDINIHTIKDELIILYAFSVLTGRYNVNAIGNPTVLIIAIRDMLDNIAEMIPTSLGVYNLVAIIQKKNPITRLEKFVNIRNIEFLTIVSSRIVWNK